MLQNSKLFNIVGLIVTVLTIAVLAITVATLVVVVKRLDSSDETGTPTTVNPMESYADRTKVEELLKHLEQLQVIADQSNGTRAIATSGFNGTLDYITEQLKQNTDFIITHQYFTVPNYVVHGRPQLQADINGILTEYNYLTNFTYLVFSARAAFSSSVRLVAIPNLGCQDADWSSVAAEGTVALVKRGDCTFPEKSIIAEKYRVRGLLIYNDGTAADRFQAVQGLRANTNSSIPAFFLSYYVGMELLDWINATGGRVNITMNIDVSDAEGIGNICADTRSGDKTKTIVVGAHSDGVPAGSGINDNGKKKYYLSSLFREESVISLHLGSGTIGVLVLALNLARLLQTSTYTPYAYRVRFCWWGAEEIGLLGSIHHVEQASLAANADRIGERLSDYLVNLNYDMLAGPNYRFGIHDSDTAPASTPRKALNGTKRITDLFRQWFNEQKLPWSNASLGGGSDYVPFLARGVAVGGVNTGAGGIKSSAERDQYAAMLGTGNGGIANAAFDPCYHQQCDRIRNINPFAYENVVKAAAYAIEYMGRLNDLEAWLYPAGRSIRFEPIAAHRLLKNDDHLS